MHLLKGFEVELFTGKPNGQTIGLSDQIISESSAFKNEIDKRHVEYITRPHYSYDVLLHELIQKRIKLRECLKQIGDYTLIPGSVMSLGGYQSFHRSEPENPYHSYVEQRYGTKLVTASVHINIGLEPEQLFRAYRLIRLEAPLYLALSAASPFLDGRVTGYHSVRWHQYPQVPAQVPLFKSHKDYIRWTEMQLATGCIHNVRQLWVSVRPNGENKPYELNRLELRICDLIDDPREMIALAAFLECRIVQLMNNPHLDPMMGSLLNINFREQQLLELTQFNENAAALHSLDAELKHWYDGRRIKAKDWIWEIYQQIQPIAKDRNLTNFLKPIEGIINKGNKAQKWIKFYQQGASCQQVLVRAIEEMIINESSLVECT